MEIEHKDREDFELYEEFDDGTIDDIAGEGGWHLEKMCEGCYAFIVGGYSGEPIAQFNLMEKEGDIVLERSDYKR